VQKNLKNIKKKLYINLQSKNNRKLKTQRQSNRMDDSLSLGKILSWIYEEIAFCYENKFVKLLNTSAIFLCTEDLKEGGKKKFL